METYTTYKSFITYNAGENIWEVEPFNSKIEWHNNEFKGSYEDCIEESERQMTSRKPHYANAEYESIFDY
tara:strand:- start:2391 stop:2600 length:210 start_codon:yes stop_codon:yes gene_type:complete